MEHVYRHRPTSSRPPKKTYERTYKKTLIQQTVLCLLLLVFCIFVKISPGGEQSHLYLSMQAIFETKTDFKNLPTLLGESYKTHILKQKQEQLSLSKTDISVDFLAPVSAPVTSPFGMRTHPTDGTEAFHYGVDLGAPEGEKIKCVAEGVVAEAGESDEYGFYVLVRHTGDIYTLYAHCQKILPKEGDSLSSGQVIGLVGATGKTTGPHLHFEIRNGENWLNPAEFIDFSSGVDHD